MENIWEVKIASFEAKIKEIKSKLLKVKKLGEKIWLFSPEVAKKDPIAERIGGKKGTRFFNLSISFLLIWVTLYSQGHAQ